jgi:hypothetical protein
MTLWKLGHYHFLKHLNYLIGICWKFRHSSIADIGALKNFLLRAVESATFIIACPCSFSSLITSLVLQVSWWVLPTNIKCFPDYIINCQFVVFLGKNDEIKEVKKERYSKIESL